MKRVILTIGRLAIGGAELRLLHLAEELAKRREPAFSLTFFVVSGLPGDLDDRIRAAGADIFYGQPGLPGLHLLWRLCREIRPAALHVNAGTAGGFYGLAGLLARVPIRIAHLRDSVAPGTKLWHPSKLAYELALNLFCNRIVGVSIAARQARWVWRPWRRIFNGLPSLEQHLGPALPPPLPHRIVMLARLGREKDIPLALRVFARMREQGHNAELHLCGPSDTESVTGILALAQDLHIADQVLLRGAIADVYPELAQASALLLTSPAEGLPGAVLEALSCGVPVVATDLPSIREIAAELPGIERVPHHSPLDQWTSALERAFAADRAAIRDQFARGPFRSAAYVEAMTSLWEGR